MDQCKPFRNCCVNLGCGTNHITSSINIDINKAVKPDIVGDMAYLPLKCASVDMVISNSVLEHVRNIHNAMREVGRVTKVGCKIILTVPTDVDGPFLRQLTKVLFNVHNNFSLRTWTRLLSANDITVHVVHRYQSYGIHVLYVLSCVFLPLLLVSWVYLHYLQKMRSEGIHIFLECEKHG